LSLLLRFEKKYDTSHWQPTDINPALGSAISVHSTPLKEWDELRKAVMVKHDGEPAVLGVDIFALKQAYSFVRHAASIFVICLNPGCIYVLNGPQGGQKFTTVEDLVRALHVEHNSVTTAVEFFQRLDQKPALGVFAMADQNIEVWGRPGLYGGWQAMLMSSSGRGVDVRGLFHGLKNLLLHLQVLYVVKTREDIEQVKKGLADSGQKIRSRLKDLESIARTGHRENDYVEESVSQWLNTVRQLGKDVDCDVRVTGKDMDDVRYLSAPGEMEDTLEELVRNAIQHGASSVTVVASCLGDDLCIMIKDNGSGLTDKKLHQVRQVLKTGRYDATLSTRMDGTGHGLLAAKHTVSNFVDGAFDIDHGAQGRGMEIVISMKLPASI